MPVQKYRVDTDKGSYDIEVEMPEGAKPISADEPDTYAGGFIKGAKEGVVGGAKGFVEGIIPGIVNGVKDTALLPITILKELASTTIGAGHLAKDPEGTLRAAAASLASLPGEAAAKLNALADLARKDPEAFGKTVGEITGETGVGVATAKLAPLAIKPVAGKVGQTMEAIGKKGAWPIRMMGAHQLGSGNPMGVATMMLPEALQKGGGALKDFGEVPSDAVAARPPSGARNIDTGPVKGLRLTPPAAPTGAPSQRVPNVGMPATANSRVQRVQMEEARAEAAAARGQAAEAARTAATDDPIIHTGKGSQRLSTADPKIQAAYRKMMGLPDPAVGAEIKAGSPTRPAIKVEESPTRGRTSDVPPADALHPDKSDLASVLRPGVTPSEMTTPDNPEWFKGGGVRIGRPPVTVQPSTDLDKLLAETKVPADLAHEGVEGINPPPPSAGDALAKETSTPVHESQGFKDLQSAVRSGPAKLTPDTPPNLLMGSRLSRSEMMGDIRARAQGGGVRVSGRNPIQLVPGTAPLSAEAQSVLDQYMKENPGADIAAVEESLRKLSGQ